MNMTTTSITGHFAMFQTVTAVEPSPIWSPTALARPPVSTSERERSARRRTMKIVIATWSGRSRQNGRPSRTS